MGLNKIEDRLSRIKSIVDGWRDSNSISRIERDLVLEELRGLYDAVLDIESRDRLGEGVDEKEVETFQPVVPIVDVVRDVVDDFDDALDIDALLGLTDDDASLPAVEEVVAEPLEVADSATDDIIVEAAPAEDGAAASAVTLPFSRIVKREITSSRYMAYSCLSIHLPASLSMYAEISSIPQCFSNTAVCVKKW
jgi:hypothetical protein